VPGQTWDLIVTMDDATGEIYSAFFIEEEGTLSSFQGVKEALLKKGLFSSFYRDRGSYYRVTAEAGDKVDKRRLTPFGRAMSQPGIQMIAPPIPRRPGGALSASLAPCRIDCPRSLPRPISPRWMRLTDFCDSVTSNDSIAGSRCSPRSQAVPLCPCSAPISITFCVAR